MEKNLKALVLGCFASSSTRHKLTQASAAFDSKHSGKLSSFLSNTTFDPKSKKPLLLFEMSPDYNIVVVAGLGEENSTHCPIEEIDLKLENIRCEAIKLCQENEALNIVLDDCGAPKSVGEVAAMSIHDVGQWKSSYKPKNHLFSLFSTESSITTNFQTGFVLGEAQNFAASLAETPSNLKTPSRLASLIASKMPPQVNCIARDKKWIQEQNMGMFLSVNQGSIEPPVLLEAHYKGKEGMKPIVLVGKGITFDSGGISIKPSASMADMKADMQGAAVVFATIRAIALLSLPVNVIGIAPFTENLPSGSATKPGDVFIAKNGKTVEVDNTDAEGRLVLGDALVYAHTFDPLQIIDLATLTGAICIALGTSASALYTKSPKILEDFKMVASQTGDRVWHMPLYKNYSKMVESKVADLVNSTKKREAGSCTAAAFLSEFVTIKEWAHLDIAGVMIADKDLMCYCPGGMSGRPTRTLIEYIMKHSS